MHEDEYRLTWSLPTLLILMMVTYRSVAGMLLCFVLDTGSHSGNLDSYSSGGHPDAIGPRKLNVSLKNGSFVLK